MLQEAHDTGNDEDVLLGRGSASNFVCEWLQLGLEADGQDPWALPSCNVLCLIGDVLLSMDGSPTSGFCNGDVVSQQLRDA